MIECGLPEPEELQRDKEDTSSQLETLALEVFGVERLWLSSMG